MFCVSFGNRKHLVESRPSEVNQYWGASRINLNKSELLRTFSSSSVCVFLYKWKASDGLAKKLFHIVKITFYQSYFSTVDRKRRKL